MLMRTMAGAVLGAALAVSAHAESFDGTYTGTRTITHSESAQGGPAKDCPGVGGKRTAIEFKVAGSTITLRYKLLRDTPFTGTIGSDGAFTVRAEWPPGSRNMVTWSGRIEGRRLRGELVGASTGGGSCLGTLTARKRS
jgi:hypothetical protein